MRLSLCHFLSLANAVVWALTGIVPHHGAGFLRRYQSTDVSAVEEVVVSSRTPDLIDQIGVSVSVLDEDTMQSLAYPDLASLLDTQPGVTVTMDGGYGKAAAVRFAVKRAIARASCWTASISQTPLPPRLAPESNIWSAAALTRVEILKRSSGTAVGSRCRWRDP